jgi:hypothetical protein
MVGKLYPCKKCDAKVKIRSKGLCGNCRKKELDSKEKTVSKYAPKVKLGEIIVRKKKEALVERDLRSFFAYHIEQILKKPICENCSRKLNGNIAEVAHIIPKRSMGGSPEIADNIHNALHLCIDCHTKFDRLQAGEGVYGMKCWVIAVERYYTHLKQHIKNINKSSSNIEKWKSTLKKQQKS